MLALSGVWEVIQGSATVAEHHTGRLDFLVAPRKEPAGDRRSGIWGELHFQWVHTRMDRLGPLQAQRLVGLFQDTAVIWAMNSTMCMEKDLLLYSLLKLPRNDCFKNYRGFRNLLVKK